jgi:hypothetical protein
MRTAVELHHCDAACFAALANAMLQAQQPAGQLLCCCART